MSGVGAVLVIVSLTLGSVAPVMLCLLLEGDSKLLSWCGCQHLRSKSQSPPDFSKKAQAKPCNLEPASTPCHLVPGRV